jgi:ribosome-interacting GTPase 1
MPANLTAEAKKKWDEVAETRNTNEKLKLLQEFLALIPKHKGTEKLQKQTKRQIATLRREIEEKKRTKKSGKGGPKFFFEKEGAAQVIILGPTKVGRSSLLASITNAKVEISDYPFTTRGPVPGMLPFEDIQFQIIEAPPLVKGAADGEGMGMQVLGLARNADGLILMVDVSQNPCTQLSMIFGELGKARIFFQRPRVRVDIERKFQGAGLRVILLGRLINCTLRDVEELLKSYRITDAVVRIQGAATLDDVEDAIFEANVYRPAMVVANKIDAASAEKRLEELENFVNGQLMVIPISCKTGQGLELLGRKLFEALGIIRVYTKEPLAKKHSPKPFILKRGATVQDLAKLIHSDFYKQFSHARVWARRLVYSPQKVGLSFVLDDKDIIEIHIK